LRERNGGHTGFRANPQIHEKALGHFLRLTTQESRTANARRGLEAGLAGQEAANGIAMLFGVHRAEEAGGGLGRGLLLPTAAF